MLIDDHEKYVQTTSAEGALTYHMYVNPPMLLHPTEMFCKDSYQNVSIVILSRDEQDSTTYLPS